jgi:deoxycytidine triphosphate deaminase
MLWMAARTKHEYIYRRGAAGEEMTILVDRQLRNLIAPAQAVPAIPAPLPPPLATNTQRDIGRWSTKIQPASLDLTIGRILLLVEDENTQQPPVSETNISLKQGETAVVETYEYISMPRTLAAIGFPPSSVSRDGLLMTNPGHVDPGFAGRLKFTVINLGKKPIELAAGKLICTLLFFSIDAPEHAYDQLDPTDKPHPPSGLTLLRKLSKDFLEFDSRIKTEVNKGVARAQVITPIIAGALAVVVTLLAGYMNDIGGIKVKMEGLEKSLPVQDLKTRVDKLENQQLQSAIQQMMSRLDRLEAQLQNPRP